MEEQEGKAELQKQSIPIEQNNIEEREDVKALQAQPKDNNLKDEYGYSPLITAILEKDPKEVKRLVACTTTNTNEHIAIPTVRGFKEAEPSFLLAQLALGV